jgi:transposase
MYRSSALRHRELRSVHRIRALFNRQGAWANIPPKRNRKDAICFSAYLYRARNLVERFFDKIKQCRRVATRYDKLAI